MYRIRAFKDDKYNQYDIYEVEGVGLAYHAGAPQVPLFTVLGDHGQPVFTMPLIRLQDCQVVPPSGLSADIAKVLKLHLAARHHEGPLPSGKE